MPQSSHQARPAASSRPPDRRAPPRRDRPARDGGYGRGRPFDRNNNGEPQGRGDRGGGQGRHGPHDSLALPRAKRAGRDVVRTEATAGLELTAAAEQFTCTATPAVALPDTQLERGPRAGLRRAAAPRHHGVLPRPQSHRAPRGPTSTTRATQHHCRRRSSGHRDRAREAECPGDDTPGTPAPGRKYAAVSRRRSQSSTAVEQETWSPASTPGPSGRTRDRWRRPCPRACCSPAPRTASRGTGRRRSGRRRGRGAACRRACGASAPRPPRRPPDRCSTGVTHHLAERRPREQLEAHVRAHGIAGEPKIGTPRQHPERERLRGLDRDLPPLSSPSRRAPPSRRRSHPPTHRRS